jgi:hypothetical protein
MNRKISVYLRLVVVDADAIELVSWAKFPRTGKFNGNLVDSGGSPTLVASAQTIDSGTFRKMLVHR